MKHIYHFVYKVYREDINIFSLCYCKSILQGKWHKSFWPYRNGYSMDKHNIHNFWKVEHFKDKAYNILLNDHKFVRLDIEDISFDLGPNNLVINIEHKQDLYQKVD